MSPAIQQAILSKVREGIPFHAAAALAGIPPATSQRWLHMANTGEDRWPDGSQCSEPVLAFLRSLREAYALASAQFEASAVASILQAGQESGKNGIREWRATAWALNNLPQTREQYREHREVKVESRSTVSHEYRRIQELPLTEVLELAGPEFAELVPRRTDQATDSEAV